MASNVTTDYEVTKTGPLFDGSWPGLMRRTFEDIEDDVADEAIEEVRNVDASTFKNPTGYATSRVTKERKGSTMTIDRGGLPYGPWLEDGGSRSDIFPGYHAFQRAAKSVESRVSDIVARSIARHLLQ
jgi:hypothetical protein